ncbi:hypothetical protein NC651_026042 [Populus alba x Populus x berolinensis]|nr:hypothetical protein NC651_026042 [Populus alba x Populus x berolinensis]
MDPLSQGTSSTPVDPPMKRKRGRPRKDESSVLGEKTPVMSESDNMKENKETTGTTGANMVGQVGDSDTPLRGLVFLPSRFIPITAANDVAPQAIKNRRAAIPIPVSYPLTQLPSFVTSPEQSDKQLVELKKLAPLLKTKGYNLGFNQLSQLQRRARCDNQCASAMVQMGHNKVAGQHDLMVEFEASLRKRLNLSVKANEQSKSVSLPAPPADILPGSETAKMELEIQQQPSSDDLKLNQPVHYGVRSPSSFMEKKASPKNVAPPEPAMKIISGDDKSHLNGSSICLTSGILLKKKKNMIEEIKLECAEKFNEEVLYLSYYFSIL